MSSLLKNGLSELKRSWMRWNALMIGEFCLAIFVLGEVGNWWRGQCLEKFESFRTWSHGKNLTKSSKIDISHLLWADNAEEFCEFNTGIKFSNSIKVDFTSLLGQALQLLSTPSENYYRFW